MKILKLLNKKYFSIILILLLGLSSYAEEQPIDIWNINKKKIDEESLQDNTENSKEEIEIKDNSNSSVYNMQSQKEVSTINLEEKLDTKEIKIIGLYDPEDYGLDINGNKVSLEQSKIDAARTTLDAEYAALEYSRNRAAEYPDFASQMDDIYHNGIDGWKATIKTIKDKYPKPS